MTFKYNRRLRSFPFIRQYPLLGVAVAANLVSSTTSHIFSTSLLGPQKYRQDIFGKGVVDGEIFPLVSNIGKYLVTSGAFTDDVYEFSQYKLKIDSQKHVVLKHRKGE